MPHLPDPSLAFWLPVVRYALWALLLALTAWWLRGTLTPLRFLTLFESESELSIRLVLAAAVVLFTLAMMAAGRLSAQLVEVNYTFAAVLLGLGTAKVVASRFAARPVGPAASTTVNTRKVEHVDAENLNVTSPPPSPPE